MKTKKFALYRRLRPRLLRAMGYAWASPTSLIGLICGGLTLCTGGTCQRVQGVLEFHGGFSRWLLERTPVGACAITFGHVILGRDAAWLSQLRPHEQVHVRQAEVWGPLFLPAYLIASGWVWLDGRHAYYDNPFEHAARRRSSNLC